MVLSLEGKKSSLPVLRVFTVLLFNKCEGFPALLVGTIIAEEPRAQLRVPLSLGTAFANARAWLSWLQWECHGI